jgi:predicted metal-binding membrane protein
MGLGVIGFVGTWALMMAAMMLPSITPFTTLYQRTFVDHRPRRIALLSAGYLAVWAITGFVAFGLAAGADRLAANAPGWAQGVAVASCFACGLYQMTSIKDRCLEHCRSPLGHLLHFASLRGRTADLRVGLSHGAWCLACCWSLMVLLITFGVMNLFAMVLLAGIILTEKVLQPGRWFSIAVGAVAIGLGVAIWVHPAFAQGLHIVGNSDMTM